MIFRYIEDPAILEDRRLNRIALVASGIHHRKLPIDTIRRSAYWMARSIVQQVHARGYRRILVMQLKHRDAEMEDDMTRRAGTWSAIEEIGRIPNGWIREVVRPKSGDLESRRRLVAKHRPDAVIGLNAGDYEALKEMGYDNPQQLGFAAQEVRPKSRSITVAGNQAGPDGMGAATIDWLDQRMRLAQFGVPNQPMDLVVSSPWIDGDSLPGQ